jgi:hypothetical protein
MKGREDEEQEVSSSWMTLRKWEDTGNESVNTRSHAREK